MIGILLAIGSEAIAKKCSLMRGIGMTRASKYLRRIQASFVVAGTITGAAFQFGPGLVHKYKTSQQTPQTQREAFMHDYLKQENKTSQVDFIRPVRMMNLSLPYSNSLN